MFTTLFWQATAERGMKSVAQALALYFGGDQVFDAWHANWGAAGGIALGAAVLSVLSSIISSKIGDSSSPSLVTGDNR